MDIRTLAAGVCSLAGIVCAAVLYARGEAQGAERLAGIAGIGLAYVVGLYSQPYDGEGEA